MEPFRQVLASRRITDALSRIITLVRQVCEVTSLTTKYKPFPFSAKQNTVDPRLASVSFKKRFTVFLDVHVFVILYLCHAMRFPRQ